MSDPNSPGFRKSIAKGLTLISHATSPFIATFLLVHLAAPVLANVGGTSLASQTMLLGREYYQTQFGENYLVLGPITVHALAGISKRLLLSLPSSSKQTKATTNHINHNSSSSLSGRRPLTSWLALTGYATTLVFLPIHFLVHRDYPTLPTESISSVGPSSLDYEYVKYGLHTWPWRSWFLYAGLVGSVSLHAAEGVFLVWNTWLKGLVGRPSPSPSRKVLRNLAIGGVVVPVLLGVYAIAKEPRMTMSFLETRYKAAYMQSSIFQI